MVAKLFKNKVVSIKKTPCMYNRNKIFTRRPGCGLFRQSLRRESPPWITVLSDRSSELYTSQPAPITQPFPNSIRGPTIANRQNCSSYYTSPTDNLMQSKIQGDSESNRSGSNFKHSVTPWDFVLPSFRNFHSGKGDLSVDVLEQDSIKLVIKFIFKIYA